MTEAEKKVKASCFWLVGSSSEEVAAAKMFEIRRSNHSICTEKCKVGIECFALPMPIKASFPVLVSA